MAALICELVHKMCYVVLVVLISQKVLGEICEQNLRVQSRSAICEYKLALLISQIFLLRAPVTQMGITSSRKLGIRICKMF